MKETNPPVPASGAARATRWQLARAALRRRPDSPYAAMREALRALIPYEWRLRTVKLARRRFGLAGLRDRLAAKPEPAAPTHSHPQSPDFFESLPLPPHLSEASVAAILDRPVARIEPRKPDVICFSIIDWSFRFQRPQQLMAQFAAHGHRVFYLNISDFLSRHARPRFSAQPIVHSSGEILAGEIQEVKLATHAPLDLAGGTIEEREVEHVLASLDELRRAFDINDAIGYVMIPSWSNVAREAQQRWGWRIVYDCMDEWENFPHLKPEAITGEKELAGNCDLLVVTAQRLHDKWSSRDRPMILARNAADYEFHAARCRPNHLLPGIKHPVAGYFGAIADWFDVELLAETARQRPDCTFVLLGGVFDIDVSVLRKLPNVRLLGQQPYETMPQYLHHFDVCLIPFRVNPITEATNPVKLYEYLCGGKPVVSLRLPELERYGDVVYLAENQAEFVAQLDAALAENDPEKAERRRAIAREQSWRSRYQQITTALADAIPRASIIVVTYNNLALTRLCLESLLRNTAHPNHEVVIVDNHSTDSTPAYLREMAARHGNLRLILNSENHGFARANNQGLAIATGDHLVLLNNDTVVPPGWLSRLLWHLGDPAVGLAGPVTNAIGNEARIETGYRTWAEMEAFARETAWSKQTRIADIPMLAMYCVAMRRDVYNRVGPLDEQFGIGMFEDDDYAMRVRRAGLRIVCAEGVFVHHFGQAAFGKLIESGAYHDLFEQNRYKFESKWQSPWQPHRLSELRFAPHNPGANRPAEPSTDKSDVDANDRLIWGLDAPLPATLQTGAGTVLYLSGWCFHRDRSIRNLAITFDGQCHPALAHSITRLDVMERNAGGARNALQSGFWAIVPVPGQSEPAAVRIGLQITLSDRTTIHVECGSVVISSGHSGHSGPIPPTGETSPPIEAAEELIAICMASYNPPLELFRRQIESISRQTHVNWICIISDDASKPEILAEMRAIIGADARFKLFPSEQRLGFYHNFERCLALAPVEARYIALADQDDCWRPEKLHALLSACDNQTQLVYSDMRIVNADGTVHAGTYWTTRANNHTNLGDLILANTITGAASLFPRRLLPHLLPFPPRVGPLYHDHWIAAVALALGRVKYIARPLYDYVQHSSNVIGHSTPDEFSLARTIYYLFRNFSNVSGRTHAREVYFQDVLRFKVMATVARLRIGRLTPAGKAWVLTRFVNLDRSPITVIWLALRGLRESVRKTVTFGTEYQMILGICWKGCAHIKARLAGFRSQG